MTRPTGVAALVRPVFMAHDAARRDTRVIYAHFLHDALSRCRDSAAILRGLPWEHFAAHAKDIWTLAPSGRHCARESFDPWVASHGCTPSGPPAPDFNAHQLRSLSGDTDRIDLV